MEFYKRLQHVASVKKKYQADVVADLKKDRPTVSKWWNGGVVPGPRNMRLLADYFGCDIKWLETGEGEPFPAHVESRVLGRISSGMPQHREKSEDPNSTIHPPHEAIEEHEAIAMLLNVIRSDTIHRPALLWNLRAFNHAVNQERENAGMKNEINEMKEQMNRMEQLLLSIAGEPSEKKRAGNAD